MFWKFATSEMVSPASPLLRSVTELERGWDVFYTADFPCEYFPLLTLRINATVSWTKVLLNTNKDTLDISNTNNYSQYIIHAICCMEQSFGISFCSNFMQCQLLVKRAALTDLMFCTRL